MMLTTEQLKLKQLLSEAIILLCKNGLSFEKELSVQALIGITLDQSDVLLINVHEILHTESHSNDDVADELISSRNTDPRSLCSKSSELIADSCTTITRVTKHSSDNLDFNLHINKNSLQIYDHSSEQNPLKPPSYKEIVHRKRERFLGAIPAADCKKRDLNHDDAVWLSFNGSDAATKLEVCDTEEANWLAANKKARLLHAADEQPTAVCNDHYRLKQKVGGSCCSFPKEMQECTNAAICPASDSSTDANPIKEVFAMDGVEIKVEQGEDEEEQHESAKEEFHAFNFLERFQDSGHSDASTGIYSTSFEFSTAEKRLDFPQERYEFLTPVQNDEASEMQFDGSVSSLVCHHVLKYEGPFVPVRDIQRRRLRHFSADVIKFAMNRLSTDNLGCYKTLCLGVMVFYKRPPSLVDSKMLNKYHISRELYEQNYNQKLFITSSNRHSDNYWERVMQSNPYSQDIL